MRIFLFCIFMGSALLAVGQKKDQYWLDFQVDYPFGNKYLFEVTGSYQNILSGSARWRNISIGPSFEDDLIRWFTLVAASPMNFTLQKEGTNSFDIAPSIGGKFHFSQGKKIDSRLTLKAEERFFRQLEAGQWETSSRLRAKVEAWISINGPNMFTDNLFYVLVDYEEFITVDQQVNERFAFIRRFRLGAGYRMNYTHRLEIVFARQFSRDEIYADFDNADSIVQLRYKLFLNPAKTQ